VKIGEAWGLAMNLSWTMLFSLLVPLLTGIWLDGKLNTMPLLTLVGAALGILAATVGVARMAVRMFSSTGDQDLEPLAGANDKEEPE
jgi:F0F1-type ATP synthase assembly protein I